MKLTVTSYQPCGDYHVCRDEDGDRHFVDLMIDGSLGGALGDMNPEDLVGRTVSVSRMQTYLYIAHDVTLEEQA